MTPRPSSAGGRLSSGAKPSEFAELARNAKVRPPTAHRSTAPRDATHLSCKSSPRACAPGTRSPLPAAPPERLRHLAVARPRPSTRGAPPGRRPRPRRHAPVPRLLTAARRGRSVTARHQHTPPPVAAPWPMCPQRPRALHALATPHRYPHLRCRRLRTPRSTASRTPPSFPGISSGTSCRLPPVPHP